MYMSFCPFKKFKNALGIPKRGVHSYRILGTAAVDYVLTLMAAFVTSYSLSIPLVLTTIVWLMLGILLHILFGVKTNTLKYLDINCT